MWFIMGLGLISIWISAVGPSLVQKIQPGGMYQVVTMVRTVIGAPCVAQHLSAPCVALRAPSVAQIDPAPCVALRAPSVAQIGPAPCVA